ncbi:RNA ligase 1 isoform X2 [Nerophis lumbriciformis]|uniref:RNA ligase 1 isoform X2 n=1 Tax=Nerophis lumbriciformis TaxID=546530 RepID=UPI002ADF2F9B|nr:RNA ligase 1-like isoform X2 [Nerophis lumbriciformis]
MRRVGSVQQKVSCVFMTEVKEEASRKRDCQPFHVVATAMVNPAVLEADLSCAVATEKLDGTCCYVSLYKGKPHLWARLDRRPNKQAEKRFKKYQYSHRSSKGWVPVEDDNKQYCWHSSVVDSSVGSALVLRPVLNNEDTLEIVALPLADLLEQTLELIGTNVNGNPYGLGSKKQPIHFLVSHGSICIRNPPPVDFQQLYSWFRGDSEGRIEGIVWHCAGGSLFKLHRHHLGLEWPAEGTHLSNKPVVVGVSGTTLDDNSKSLFVSFSRMNGRCFSRLHDVHFDLEIQSTT